MQTAGCLRTAVSSCCTHSWMPSGKVPRSPAWRSTTLHACARATTRILTFSRRSAALSKSTARAPILSRLQVPSRPFSHFAIGDPRGQRRTRRRTPQRTNHVPQHRSPLRASRSFQDLDAHPKRCEALCSSRAMDCLPEVPLATPILSGLEELRMSPRTRPQAQESQ